MISFDNVTRRYSTPSKVISVLERASFDFPDNRHLAIVGPPRSGKSTVIRLIAGALVPNRGLVRRSGRYSWPLGTSGGFSATLTPRDNIRFVSRLYGEPERRVTAFVKDFLGIGKEIDLLVTELSLTLRIFLALSLALALELENYLVDGSFLVGTKKQQERMNAAFLDLRRKSRFIIASPRPSLLKSFCDCAVVIENRRLILSDLDTALPLLTAPSVNPRGEPRIESPEDEDLDL